MNLFYYNLFDKNSSLIRNSKRFFISLCKYKNNILICKIFKDFFLKIFLIKFYNSYRFRHCKDKDFILIYKKIRENFFVKNEFYYFKNNFQKIFAYLKNFIICAYIIYYQKFLSNFYPLTSGRPKLPARCPLYNTCMITN